MSHAIRNTLRLNDAFSHPTSLTSYHRVLRVARTLADMDGGDGVKRVHIAEALSYRRIVVAAG